MRKPARRLAICPATLATSVAPTQPAVSAAAAPSAATSSATASSATMPTTYSDQPERILEEPHRDVPRRVISRRVEMKQPPSAGEVASRSELDEFFGPNPRAETAMLTGGAATFDVMDQSGHRRVETLREYNDQVGQGALRAVRSAFGEKD